MKNCLMVCSLVFILLASGSIQTSDAQEYPNRMQTGRTVQAYQASNPPIIDGDLSEWPQIGESKLDYSSADTIQGLSPSLADASATMQVVWNKNTIYFAIRVSDDVIVTDNSDVWRDDGIELGIDGNADGQRSGPTDHQYTLVADGRNTDFGVPFPDATFSVQAVSGGYQMEYAIPASHVVGGALSDNQLMGFTWSLHDDDDGGQWDTWMIWEGDQTGTHYDQFGQLILNPQVVSFPLAPPRRTVQAYRTHVPPTIDGDLSEWLQMGEVALNVNTADTVHDEPPSSFADSSASLRVSWDEDALYFAVHAFDDFLVADSSQVWQDDGIELGIDGNYDRIFSGPTDHQYTIVIDGRYTDQGVPFSGATLAVRQFNGGYDMEFAVPASLLVGESFASGNWLGFTWAIHDDDDEGRWEHWMVWEGDQTSTNFEKFGEIYLNDSPTATPTPTSTSTLTPTSTPTPTVTPSHTPEPASVYGIIYEDVNENGQLDGGESPIAGAVVTLTGSAVDLQTTTETDGKYIFDLLASGSYQLDVIPPPAYGPSNPPTPLGLLLNSGNNLEQNFGLSLVPTPTPTLTQSPTTIPTPLQLYLPLLLQNYSPPTPTPTPTRIPPPATPHLQAISNSECGGAYQVFWSSTNNTTSYTLQEARDPAFSLLPAEAYAGPAISVNITGHEASRYYYRVKARNTAGDSAWSNAVWTDVCWEKEPNNAYTTANGPLASGKNYHGYPNDLKDYFSVFIPTSGELNIDLTGHVGNDVQLQLFYQQADAEHRVGYDPKRPFHIAHAGPAGWYYIYIRTESGFSETMPYTLRVSYH